MREQRGTGRGGQKKKGGGKTVAAKSPNTWSKSACTVFAPYGERRVPQQNPKSGKEAGGLMEGRGILCIRQGRLSGLKRAGSLAHAKSAAYRKNVKRKKNPKVIKRRGGGKDGVRGHQGSVGQSIVIDTNKTPAPGPNRTTKAGEGEQTRSGRGLRDALRISLTLYPRILTTKL